MELLQLLLTPGVLIGGVVFLWRVYAHGRSQDREYVQRPLEVMHVKLVHLGDNLTRMSADVRSLGESVGAIDKRLVALETLVQERSSMSFAAGVMAMQSWTHQAGAAAGETLPGAQPGSGPAPGAR